MRRRPAFVSSSVVLGAAAALALAGCSSAQESSATVGLGRGGQRGEVIGIVVVCSGVVDGLDLAVDDAAPLLVGDGLRRLTRWASPDTVVDLGATDLVGRTVWPADTVIERFVPGVDYTLGAYAEGRSMSARPVVFHAEQFDTLSVGEVIVGDVRDETGEVLSVENFLGLACESP